MVRLPKIVHICLASFFIDGYSYQENLLPKWHKKHGYDVEIIASTQVFNSEGKLDTTESKTYYTEDGIKVTRLNYRWKNRYLRKLRQYKGLREELDRAKPDILFIHGCQFSDLLIIRDYVSTHNRVEVYIDNHADYYNSANTFLSKWLLHRVIWRTVVNTIDSYVNRYWGVSQEACDFLHHMYGLDTDKIGLLPLGADDEDVIRKQNEQGSLRKKLNIDSSSIVVVTGGKLDENKGIIESIVAFRELGIPNCKLLIFGNVNPNIRRRFDQLLSDNVIFVGWVDGKDINHLLLECDLGLFPGTQSVLWMQAVVCGLPCIFKKWINGNPVDIGGNCLLIENTKVDEIKEALQSVLCSDMLREMKTAAQSNRRFDYGYSRLSLQAIQRG